MRKQNIKNFTNTLDDCDFQILSLSKRFMPIVFLSTCVPCRHRIYTAILLFSFAPIFLKADEVSQADVQVIICSRDASQIV